jgi:uncharacterized RDD family membrane protein YckC
VKVARSRLAWQNLEPDPPGCINMTPAEEQPGRNHDLSRFAPDDRRYRDARFLPDLVSGGEPPRFILDPAGDGTAIPEDPGSSEGHGTAPGRGEGQDDNPQEEIGNESRATPSSDLVSPPDWRNLVSAKVSSYKSRRPRPHRYPSLQLKFEQSPMSRESRSASGGSSLRAHYSTSGAVVPSLEPQAGQFEAPPMSEPTARVLEFPRSMAMPVRWDELAEPIIDRPRIVEAPELVPPPPAMGGILIEPSEQPAPERRPGFDMPLASASLRRRLTAGLIDVLVVVLAILAFAYVFLHVSDARATWRTAYAFALGLMVVLWPAYQFALVVFSGTTPGLRLCRLRIERFDGRPAPRRLRIWRVVVSLLSAISLAIGYLWCFLDEDQLSWHDRITSTHLADTSRSAQDSRPNYSQSKIPAAE